MNQIPNLKYKTTFCLNWSQGINFYSFRTLLREGRWLLLCTWLAGTTLSLISNIFPSNSFSHLIHDILRIEWPLPNATTPIYHTPIRTITRPSSANSTEKVHLLLSRWVQIGRSMHLRPRKTRKENQEKSHHFVRTINQLSTSLPILSTQPLDDSPCFLLPLSRSITTTLCWVGKRKWSNENVNVDSPRGAPVSAPLEAIRTKGKCCKIVSVCIAGDIRGLLCWVESNLKMMQT